MNERPVRPRQPYDKHHHVIAVTRHGIYLERTGEIREATELPEIVKSEPSSILVAERMTGVVQYLDERFRDDERWQYKLKSQKITIYRPDSPVTTERTRTVVCFLGFRDDARHNRYHHCLDPTTFASLPIQGLKPDNDPLNGLIEWGIEIRDFCVREALRPSFSTGGLAGQLLRDRRFFPNPRRKVPRATNRISREQLPGNYYRLTLAGERAKRVPATYIDLKNAHHEIARDLSFPDANTLYCSGAFRSRSSWRAHPCPEKVLKEHGLFLLSLRGQVCMPKQFPPPYLDALRPGKVTQAYVYSNELPLLAELGIRIVSVIAAWTSPDIDTGLNRYASWALSRLKEASSEQRTWLKPLLLTTYGLLGVRPRPLEFGFKRAKSGNVESFPTERGFLRAYTRKTSHEIEPGIANVIWRGMIEAECRLKCLNLARSLTRQGIEVLAIYADSIFVRSDRALPLLEPPWRIKGHLTDLEFFNATSFQSLELTRLPGIPREARERIARKKSFRALTKDRQSDRVLAVSK